MGNEKAGGTGWQKCPVCDGTGKTLADAMVSMNTVVSCDVCVGKKIINIQTGKPPKD